MLCQVGSQVGSLYRCRTVLHRGHDLLHSSQTFCCLASSCCSRSGAGMLCRLFGSLRCLHCLLQGCRRLCRIAGGCCLGSGVLQHNQAASHSLLCCGTRAGCLHRLLRLLHGCSRRLGGCGRQAGIGGCTLCCLCSLHRFQSCLLSCYQLLSIGCRGRQVHCALHHLSSSITAGQRICRLLRADGHLCRACCSLCGFSSACTDSCVMRLAGSLGCLLRRRCRLAGRCCCQCLLQCSDNCLRCPGARLLSCLPGGYRLSHSRRANRSRSGSL